MTQEHTFDSIFSSYRKRHQLFAPFAVIFSAPQGCWKTRLADKLLAHFDCQQVVEEFCLGDPITPGALHLTNVPFDQISVYEYPNVSIVGMNAEQFAAMEKLLTEGQ